MERMNKVALLINLLFFGTKRVNLSKPMVLSVAILFLEYTFVFREKNEFAIVSI